MTYTTTEEREFRTDGKAMILVSAVTIAQQGMQNLAKEAGYREMVIRSFGMHITAVERDSGEEYLATAWGTFARIVSLPAEPNEGEMEAEIEAREPEGKDYAGDLDMSDPSNWTKAEPL